MVMPLEPISMFPVLGLATSACLGRQHTVTPARLYGLQRHALDAEAGPEDRTR